MVLKTLICLSCTNYSHDEARWWSWVPINLCCARGRALWRTRLLGTDPWTRGTNRWQICMTLAVTLKGITSVNTDQVDIWKCCSYFSTLSVYCTQHNAGDIVLRYSIRRRSMILRFAGTGGLTNVDIHVGIHIPTAALPVRTGGSTFPATRAHRHF